jgi:hypothetical protein
MLTVAASTRAVRGGRGCFARAATASSEKSVLVRLKPVSQERARQKAADMRAAFADGRDPLAEKRQAAIAAKIETAKATTFEQAAQAHIRSQRSAWKSPKSLVAWEHTLNDFAYPIIGKLPVGSIDTDLVSKVLEQPIGDEGTLWLTRSARQG